MAFRKNSDWRFRLPFYFISRPKGCNPGSAGGLLHTRIFKGLMPESRWLNRNFFQRRNVRTHLNRKCAVVLRIKSVGKTLWTSWWYHIPHTHTYNIPILYEFSSYCVYVLCMSKAYKCKIYILCVRVCAQHNNNNAITASFLRWAIILYVYIIAHVIGI